MDKRIHRKRGEKRAMGRRIKTIITLLRKRKSELFFSIGPCSQFELPSDEIGLIIFKIFGMDHITMFTLFCQIIKLIVMAKKRKIIFFILFPFNSGRRFTSTVIDNSTY